MKLYKIVNVEVQRIFFLSCTVEESWKYCTDIFTKRLNIPFQKLQFTWFKNINTENTFLSFCPCLVCNVLGGCILNFKLRFYSCMQYFSVNVKLKGLSLSTRPLQ